MTKIEFTIFRGHYYFPLHFLGTDGRPISEPILAYFDTGASKCSIPIEANKIFNLPIVDHDSNVNTASSTVGYDVVRIPLVYFMKLVFTPPNKLQLMDTDLQEANVEAWLHNRYIIGMNLISKFDFELKRTGHITIAR
jgi:hypothetical protein